MASRILQQGILDIKAPRGNENRKLLKPWRHLWVSFFVYYPSGRREPLLILDIAQSRTDAPEKQIRVSRDGLRLFRCRSRSRPYRTWAIMSGKKLLLYFAASNEVEAQKWMQAVRDGLWPPCFSFQMLTACTHEVSLIDDENTFQSGLLGVYGRFVLTSQDVISLMHPHWGAILLQISLANIQDVYLVRKAEVSSTGVFNIALKSIGDGIKPILQFYCMTAVDAIQWISSNVLMYSDRTLTNKSPLTKLGTSSQETATTESSATKLEHDEVNTSMTKANSISQEKNKEQDDFSKESSEYANLKFLNAGSVLSVNFPSCSNSNNSQYENLKFLTESSTLSEYFPTDCFTNMDSAVYSVVKKEKDLKHLSHPTPITQCEDKILSSNVESSQCSKNITSEDTDYKKINASNEDPETYIQDINTLVYTNNVHYEKLNILNASSALNENSQVGYCNTDSPVYAVVKKEKDLKHSSDPTLIQSEIKIFGSNISSSHCSKNIISEEDSEYGKINSLNEIPEIDNSAINTSFYTDNLRYENLKAFISCPDVECSADQYDEMFNSTEYAIMNKQNDPKESNREDPITQTASGKLGDEYIISERNCLRLLPDIPSDLLDTSINFSEFNRKLTKGSSSSEDEETEASSPCFEDILNSDHVYAAIIDRKGTVYEEIDASDGEDETPIPPQLPERPKNLKLPTSLRLKRLSDSISETLKIIENPHSSSKNTSRPTIIQKIIEMSKN